MMPPNHEQFRKADLAIERSVTEFIRTIEQMTGRWDVVAPTYIVEGVLLKLCEELTKLIDDPHLIGHLGSATLKLSNALADYRDSRWEDRS
jgi:hypothetical protein